MVDGNAVPESMRAAIIAALPRLRRFCQAMAGNASDGDDLMQSAVERGLSRSHQFQLGTRVDSWLFRIAQNIHIDTIRATKRRGSTVQVDEIHGVMGEDGRVVVEGRSELAAVQRALQTVPQDQRAAFLLVVVEGMSYKEAAEALEVPVGTIMSRLARARGRIEQTVGAGAQVLQ